jgi:nucleoside-diphosphate-sugar epimerase
VFVLGGTGAIGKPAVAALAAAGHHVTALARTPEKAALVQDLGGEPVEVSMFDAVALTEAFADHDAVANLATAMPSTSQFIRIRAWRETQRVRTEGSAAVVDAALAAGVRTLIQESVSMLYADQGSSWIDEGARVDHYPMAVGNHAAEASADRFTAAGRTGVILRFGLFYGPGARHSEQFHAMARCHLGVVVGRSDGYLSSIHVGDAATAVVAALNAPAGTFNVVDDEPLTKRDYAAALATAVGKATWLAGPGRAGHLLGHRLTSLTRSLRVSNARFRSETGWVSQFPSAREGWVATSHALQRAAS